MNTSQISNNVSIDSWGRHYSNTPIGLPHDSRLFTTQILIAIASSSQSWINPSFDGFSLMGFSLGRGIVMPFAARYA